MSSGPSNRNHILPRCLLVLAVWYSALPLHAVTNGSFEQTPTRTWLTDGHNTPGIAQGDRPIVAVGVRGNRYGHVGDSDGKQADGENPGRIFQWFACGDSVSLGSHCAVSFRFRTLLLPGELAWVRVQSSNQRRVLLIPNSNNQWTAGRTTIILPDGCEEDQVYLEYGMIKKVGGQVGGRLNIDDVEHRRDIRAGLPAHEEDWGFLPPIPEREAADPLPGDPISTIFLPREGQEKVGFLILACIAMFAWKLRNS